jgi:hypothetical protein
MSIKISNERFEECYMYIKDNQIPECFVFETEDTDILTGIDFIWGAVYDYKKGIPPDKINLKKMDNFLNSMYRIFKNPLIPKEKEYQDCIKFTDALSTLYNGLLERQVKPIPFPLSKSQNEILQNYIERTKTQCQMIKEMSEGQFQKISPISFKGNIYINFHSQLIPIKVIVDFKENIFVATTNVIFFDESWLGICIHATEKGALQNLIDLIIKYFSKIKDNTTQQFCIDKYF